MPSALNWLSTLWAHPASVLVTVVIAALLIRLLAGRLRGDGSGGRFPPSSLRSYPGCLLSGALLVNALAHFTHGISGETFPAPFDYLLGSALAANLSNVVWGFINLVLGAVLFSAADVRGGAGRTGVFFFGVLATGLFLSVVFSR
jgi:hypothetical protein